MREVEVMDIQPAVCINCLAEGEEVDDVSQSSSVDSPLRGSLMRTECVVSEVNPGIDPLNLLPLVLRL